MRRHLQVYVYSVAFILLLTGTAKLYSATGHAKVLDIPESLLLITIRQVLLVTAFLEIGISMYLWLSRNDRFKLLSINWLGGMFLLYRVLSILLTVGKPCPCLGSITEKIPLKPATIDHILGAVVAYMLFGSIFFLRARPWGSNAPRVNGNVALPVRHHRMENVSKEGYL